MGIPDSIIAYPDSNLKSDALIAALKALKIKFEARRDKSRKQEFAEKIEGGRNESKQGNIKSRK